MPSPLFLINSVYSYKNRGDSAIVEATGRYIQSICPSAQIGLLSSYWKENEHYYESLGWSSLPLIWDIPLNENKRRRLLNSIPSFLSLISSPIKCLPRTNPIVKFYHDATAIIDVGGGTLFSSKKYRLQLSFYQHLLSLWVARVYGKPVIISPQSIGPFYYSLDKLAARLVLSKLTTVMAREPITSNLLSSMGVKHLLVPDIAFLGNFIISPSESVQHIIAKLRRERQSRLCIGVTVLDWQWAKLGSDSDSIKHYLEQLCTALEMLAKVSDLQVCIFQQVARGVDHDDSVVSTDFASLLQNRFANTNSVVYDARDETSGLSPSDLSHIYGAMDLFIASRLHSAIFSLLQGIPSISLAYQPKARGTYEMLGLYDWVFDIDAFQSNNLYLRCLDILANPQQSKLRVAHFINQTKQKVTCALDQALRPLVITQ